MVFIYIICKNKKEAQKISLFLLKKRLIACTNIFPIESYYWWKNKIEHAKEFAILAKTVSKNYNKIKIEVKKIHSYTVPCICLLSSKANKEYINWINQEVR